MLKELIVPAGILACIGSILVPMPPVLMDVLLVGNLTLALVLLISSLYISEPLKVSSLPTILLLATLYRLALNISTTRLILSSGRAGQMIDAFGGIVIQGNLVVGAVVFLIITLVQFIVIAKGSERVAEVAARFTLDALPGKQMSIDADVRAGLIDTETAKQKRDELQIESRFYGALDGAMKFVKGDSIAGLVITAINVLGGFTLGMFVHKLDFSKAVSTYTLLTVGDGLLSQIPALLNAVTAGIIITRVARGDGVPLAVELLKQIGQIRRSKIIVALVILALALAPGMPFWPLAGVGTAFFLLYLADPGEQKPVLRPKSFDPGLHPLLALEIDRQAGKDLLHDEKFYSALEQLRQDLYNRTGLILPPVSVAAADLPEKKLVVKVRGIEHTSLDETALTVDSVISLIAGTVKNNAAEFIDDIMTRRLLDYFEQEAPELAAAAVPGAVSVTQITAILKNLAAQGITVRHLDLILQAVVENSSLDNDRMLLEEVRVALKRVIAAKYKGSTGSVRAYTVNPMIDLAAVNTERSNQLLDPRCIAAIEEYLSDQKPGEGEVLVVSKGARRIVEEALRIRQVKIPVLAFEEIEGCVNMEVIGEIPFVEELDGEEEKLIKLVA